MIKCVDCGGEAAPAAGGRKCASCGREFSSIDGVYSFMASGGESAAGFSDSFFEVNFKHERRHFWFTSRNSLLMRMCKRFARAGADFVEIGCGTGSMLDLLSRNGWKTAGTDISLTALKFAKTKAAADFYHADIRTLPFSEEFDAAVMADVLEHIEDDSLALENVNKALRSGGLLFLTVPAVSSIYGPYDMLLSHKRRYDILPLETLVRGAGFDILKSTHFNFFLFPVIYAARKIFGKSYSALKQDNELLKNELRIIPVANAVFRCISYFEEFLAMRLRLPIGGSIFIVARKRYGNPQCGCETESTL